MSRALWQGRGTFPQWQRAVVGLSLVTIESMALISLYQMGISNHLPELSLPPTWMPIKSMPRLRRMKNLPPGRKNPVLLHKNIHKVNVFVQKNKRSHAAASKADVWVGHQTKISCTA